MVNHDKYSCKASKALSNELPLVKRYTSLLLGERFTRALPPTRRRVPLRYLWARSGRGDACLCSPTRACAVNVGLCSRRVWGDGTMPRATRLLHRQSPVSRRLLRLCHTASDGSAPASAREGMASSTTADGRVATGQIRPRLRRTARARPDLRRSARGRPGLRGCGRICGVAPL